MLQLNTLLNASHPQTQKRLLINSLKKFAIQQHLSESTITHHITWVLRFIQFHNQQHPADLNQSDIETYLSMLAIEQNYNSDIQLAALSALRFLFEEFLKVELTNVRFMKIRKRRGYSDRFGFKKCNAIINKMKGASQLIAEIAVHCQLKINEVIHLKLTDVNLKKNTIQILNQHNQQVKFIAKIPLHIILDLRIQLMRVRQANQSQLKVTILNSKDCFIKHEYLFPYNLPTTEYSKNNSSRKTLNIFFKSELIMAIKKTSRIKNKGKQLSVISPLKSKQQSTFNFNHKNSLILGAA
jgi:integrase